MLSRTIADVTNSPIYNGISDPASPTVTDLLIVAKNVLDILTYIAGSLAILAIVASGIMIMTSGGNSARLEKGKKYLLLTLIGVALIVGADFIVRIIINLTKGAFV